MHNIEVTFLANFGLFVGTVKLCRIHCDVVIQFFYHVQSDAKSTVLGYSEAIPMFSCISRVMTLCSIVDDFCVLIKVRNVIFRHCNKFISESTNPES